MSMSNGMPCGMNGNNRKLDRSILFMKRSFCGARRRLCGVLNFSICGFFATLGNLGGMSAYPLINRGATSSTRSSAGCRGSNLYTLAAGAS